jgi:hypothetical protein
MEDDVTEDDVTGHIDEIRSTISVQGGSAQDLHSRCQALTTRQTTGDSRGSALTRPLRPHASGEGLQSISSAPTQRRRSGRATQPTSLGICRAQAAQIQGQLRLLRRYASAEGLQSTSFTPTQRRRRGQATSRQRI